MSRPVRALLLAAAAVATLSAALAGCNRDADEARAPLPPAKGDQSAVVTPADAAAPFAFDNQNAFASVKLTLPQAIRTQPDLHARLYSTAVRDLRQFTEGAQADRTEAGGDAGMAPYEKIITFDGVVETGKLFSLSRADYDFTGGAHGNTLYAGVLWDKALKRPVEGAALFRPGVDFAALDRALCAAVNAARRARDPQAAPLTATTKDWACPKASATPFVLAAGSVPGKAGGLSFLIGPYILGPYSDGSWTIVVPQSAFRPLLAPAYADEFAGEPATPASAA
jgi:hypothetical protein